MGLDDHFDLNAVVDRVLAQLVEEHGEEWIVERSDRLEAPTHGNAKGVLFNPDFSGDGVLAGPSPEGLGDPGHCALISLNQLTTTLLTLDSGPSMPLVIGTMLRLGDEAGDAFLAAARALADRLVIQGDASAA